MTVTPGVEASALPVIPAGMGQLAESCDICPIRRADEIRRTQGEDAAAHVLRVQLVELVHKVGVLRSRIRALGADPDVPYHPTDVDHA